MSPPRLKALRESLEETCRLPADTGWERKAAAHATFFAVLAEAADDPVVAPVLVSGAEVAYDLMITAGRAADGIVINSRRRFLECLRAGDPDGAALELEDHLRILHVMCRLIGVRPHRRRNGRSAARDHAPSKSMES
jgi:DNA-binding FadR family transcriptional regulator